jgi:uncharacterized protein (TIGR00369 family)
MGAEAAMGHSGRVVFGGIVAAMIDHVASLAIRSCCDPTMPGDTTSLHVDYLRPMPLGAVYICHGEAVRVGPRIAVGDARVLDAARTLMARGSVTIAFASVV